MTELLKIKVYRTQIEKVKNKINLIETIKWHEEIIELCECCHDEVFLLQTNELITKWFLKFNEDYEEIEYLTIHDNWTGLKMLGIKIKLDKDTEVLYYLDVDGCDDEDTKNYYSIDNNKQEEEEETE